MPENTKEEQHTPEGYTSKWRVWELNTGEDEWIVHDADDRQSVIDWYRKETGIDVHAEFAGEYDLDVLPGYQNLTIDRRDDGEGVISMTCDEWARELEICRVIAGTVS